MGASGTLRGPVSGAARPVAGQSQAGPKAASALLAQACPLEAGQGPDHSPHLRRRHQVVARSVLASPPLCSAWDLDVPTPSASGDQGHIQLGWHRTVLSVCTTTSRWWALEKGESGPSPSSGTWLPSSPLQLAPECAGRIVVKPGREKVKPAEGPGWRGSCGTEGV